MKHKLAILVVFIFAIFDSARAAPLEAQSNLQVSSALTIQQSANQRKAASSNSTHTSQVTQPNNTTSTSPEQGVGAVGIVSKEPNSKGAEKRASEEEDGSEFFTFWRMKLKITDAVIALFTVILAIATVKLWLATKRLWQGAEDTTKILERAFVSFDGFNVELTTLADTKIESIPEEMKAVNPHRHITRFAVQPKWRNSGRTPTRNMRIQVNYQGPGGLLSPKCEYHHEPSPFFLPPNASDASQFIEIPGVQSLVEYGMNPLSKKYSIGDSPVFFIFGRADYEDVFNKKHYVEWCRQIRFEAHRGKELGVSFIQAGDHNRAD